MANNSYTKTYADGASLTELKLDQAFQSLQMDLAQSAQLTTGASAGQVFTVSSGGSAAVWSTPSDPVGVGYRNVGLSASTSSGSLIIALKTNAGSNPTSTDSVDITFSSSGAASAVGQKFTQTSSLTLSITASATLGVSSATTSSIYVYGVRVSSSSLKLAVSTNSALDYGAKQTTVAMSASSDTFGTLYSNASASTYPIKLLGWISASHASGTWNNIYSVNLASGQLTRNPIISSTNPVAVAGSMAISPSSGSFSTTSSSYVNVTGNSQSFASGAVTTGSDSITLTSHGFVTGEVLNFTSSGTLPAGLAASTDYYAILVDVNTFKVASSFAQAIANTPVDITTQGTGTHKVYAVVAVTLTTVGNPVDIYLSDSLTSAAVSTIELTTSLASTGIDARLLLVRGASNWENRIGVGGASSSSLGMDVPPGIIRKTDTVAAGTYTYKVQAKVTTSNTTLAVSNVILIAKEFK